MLPDHERAEGHTRYVHIHAMVSRIPSGQVATYGQIARLVGRCTARMVGYAMAGLPQDTDIPWHRVINAKGQISIRFGEGASIQRQRLEAEGVEFDSQSRVDLSRYLWPGPDAARDDLP